MLRPKDACQAILVFFIIIIRICQTHSQDDGFKPIVSPVWSRAVAAEDRTPARALVYGDALDGGGGGGSFVPKTIPIRKTDAVPKLKRNMLYNGQSAVPVDFNGTRVLSRRTDVYDAVDDEEASTRVWLSNVARALVVLENAISNEGDVIEVEGRSKIGKKYKKYMLPLLLAYKLKFMALIPLMMGGLVLLAGSTGFAGFFFALFAATMGLKSGHH